jgi:DNA uptake protein ComE-like DNA-binding protein
MQIVAVMTVRCGKTYSPGQSIPDGVLSDRDIKVLLELGSIKVLDEKSSEALEDTPAEVSPAGSSDDGERSPTTEPVNILDYVNAADEAGLAKIKGVGKTTAKAMASHGAFASIKELKELVPAVDWDSIEIT